jgi:hypothetical protein
MLSGVGGMKRKNIDRDALVPISDRMTYPMPVFMKYVGWGRHALTMARRRGLRVVRVGGRCFVRGADFSAFLASVRDMEGE